jgi:hypothetical protein
MRCAEKEQLQRNCMAAWDAFAAAVARPEGLLHHLAGARAPSAISLLIQYAGKLAKPAGALTNALQLRGKHLEASRALSAHICRHRC